MNESLQAQPAPHLDALDFELTDFDDARRALEELPEGVERLARRGSDHWASHRRAAGPADKALTGAALDWLMRLPASARPHHLATAHPRLANRLADAWADRSGALAAIYELLRDLRGGRRGFPARVQAEIVALRELLQR